jgi:predicted aspartyl protease
MEGKMIVPYNSDFDPPAAVLSATLSGVIRSRPRLHLPALIDTGADLTAVPVTAVKQLHLYEVGRIEVENIQAQVTLADIYTVNVSVADLPARELEVVLTAHSFVVLGRDWLQAYYLLLNGPEQHFELSQFPLEPKK